MPKKRAYTALITVVLLSAAFCSKLAENETSVGENSPGDLDSKTESSEKASEKPNATDEEGKTNDLRDFSGPMRLVDEGLNTKVVTIEIFPPKIGRVPSNSNAVETGGKDETKENSISVDIPNPFDGSASVSEFEKSEKKDTEPTAIEIDDAVVDFSLLCIEGTPLLVADQILPCSPNPGPQDYACPYGYWCHVGSTKKTTYCCPTNENVEDFCLLPPSQGYGTGEMFRWWYDWAAKKCRKIAYTGYGGNQNNHLTEEDCEKNCLRREPEPSSVRNAQKQPKIYEYPEETDSRSEVGAAEAGNDGVFLPQQETIYPDSFGSFSAPSESVPGYAESVQHVYVPQAPPGYIYVPVGETVNVDHPSYSQIPYYNMSLASTMDSKLPLDKRCYDVGARMGNGTAFATKWYYDVQVRRCRSFLYSGEGGTTNKFDSAFECNYYCGSNRTDIYHGSKAPSNVLYKQVNSDPCSFVHNSGSKSTDGLAPATTRYHWDAADLNCKEFTYLGAGGNLNNFLTEAQCMDTCGGGHIERKQSVCQQETMTGAGSYQIPRWTYNARRRECVQFYYSGCCGNNNRFPTYDTCMQTCTTGTTGINIPYQPYPGSGSTVQPYNPAVIYQPSQPAQPYQPGQPYQPTGQPGQIFQPAGQPGQTGNPCQNSFGQTQLQYCSANTNYQCPAGQFCHVGDSVTTTVCCPSLGGSPCSQQRTEGTGNAQLPRWYFNAQMGRCESFTYRGLQGNENNFLTYDRCNSACGSTSAALNPCGQGTPYQQNGLNIQCSANQQTICPQTYYCHIGADTLTSVCCPSQGNACQQQVARGTGNGQLQRWGFDPQNGLCRSFLYSGMGGNENNFLTQGDCQGMCRSAQPANPCGNGSPATNQGGRDTIFCSTSNANICPQNYYCHIGAGAETTLCCPVSGNNPCALPLATGTGNAVLSRWYYDAASTTCRAFTYTGINGNENNFLSLADCRRICPEYDNPCPGGNPPVNVATGQVAFCTSTNPTCPPGNWCHIGANRQTSVCCPFPGNPCNMPRVEGTGTAQLPRYYYNPTSRQCETLTYTGRGGNQNNFLSKSECEAACPILDNPCTGGMPAITPDGNPLLCSTANPNICPTTFWCHIGANAGTTLCCPGAGDPCRMPRATGSGTSVLNRWYYNTDTQTCLSFTYTGRGGNQNNFISLAECRLRCPEFVNPCSTGQPHIGLNGQITKCGATAPSICPTTYWCHIGATLDTSVCCPGAGNPCDLPLAMGNGNANLLRYFYDRASQTCRQYQYTGMNGNQNNFMTLTECESRCPVFRNPCATGSPARSPQGQLVPCSVSNLASCPATFWCHVGSDEQSTLCCPGAAAPCQQPQVVGTGSSSLPRFYYNSLTRQCLPFTYSGLGGNQNNFLSRADCQRSCPVFANPCAQGPPATGANGQYVLCTSTTPNVCPAGYWCHIGDVNVNSVCCPGAENACLLPVATGNGNVALPRWYFDTNVRRCTRFTYSGIGGNQNNFLSMQDCQLRCPEFQNPCAAGSPAQAPTGGILFCSTTAQTCPATYWCHVGDTSEATVCCPGASNPCLQGMVPGIGSARLTRWYFNQNTRQCLEFTYTGRGGNQNNFLSEAECAQRCPVFRNPCSSTLNPPQVVYCSAQNRDVCPANYYCHIGATTETSVCCPGSADPCTLSVATGTGTGFGPLSRWYFDPTRRICQQFQYTGLGGNQNNFLTQQECQQKCPEFVNPCFNGQPYREVISGLVRYCNQNALVDCPQNYFCHIGANLQTTVCCPGSQDPCTMTLAVGSGPASLPRWYFNSRTRQCQQFTYSGIAGNRNNFLTQQDCQRTCPEFSNPCGGNGTPLTSISGQITYCTAENPNICPVNYYCHVGIGQDTTVCCPTLGDRCNLPRDIGRGNGALQRYFFNPLTRQCETFTYTGISGNANNFVTLSSCRQRCPEFNNPCIGQPYRSPGGQILYCNAQSVCPPNYFCHYGQDTTTTLCCPTTSQNPCQLPVIIGSGQTQLTRYYYNYVTRQCVPFVYSGLGGNENNFRTAPECQARCQSSGLRLNQANPCALGAQPYRDRSGSTITCGSSTGELSGVCPLSYYCHVGADVYNTVCCPIGASSPCALPLRLGVGNSRMQRWYFDNISQQCQLFTYLGMQGNANNFGSQQECESRCRPAGGTIGKRPTAALCPQGEPMIDQSEGKPLTCSLQKLNQLQRVDTDQCPAENYVCHVHTTGNAYCCPDPKSFCLLPRSPGPCQNNGTLEIRYGYSPATDSCVKFQYSGCGGNLNNFEHLESCTNICCNKGYNFVLNSDVTSDDGMQSDAPAGDSETLSLDSRSADSSSADSSDSLKSSTSLADSERTSWWRRVIRLFRL